MENEFRCPLVNSDIDETICYDIQMVTGKLINRRILDDYSSLFDADKVTNERAEAVCPGCLFNQLKQPAQEVAKAV